MKEKNYKYKQMKEKKLLNLKKLSIIELNDNQLTNIMGGTIGFPETAIQTISDSSSLRCSSSGICTNY